MFFNCKKPLKPLNAPIYLALFAVCSNFVVHINRYNITYIHLYED